jgi:hypothetical protein
MATPEAFAVLASRKKVNIMTGIIRFHSLAEAIRQGYQIYDKTSTGYLLRIMTPQGWAMALCELV